MSAFLFAVANVTKISIAPPSVLNYTEDKYDMLLGISENTIVVVTDNKIIKHLKLKFM